MPGQGLVSGGTAHCVFRRFRFRHELTRLRMVQLFETFSLILRLPFRMMQCGNPSIRLLSSCMVNSYMVDVTV